MKFYLIISSLIFLSVYNSAQNFSVSGSIIDFETKEHLGFANIRVLNSNLGTSSNKLGDYELKLSAGNYILVASYIGYISDTIKVELKSNLRDISFFLEPSKVDLPEITILPGENPAIRIIKKAIERKILRNSLISQYEFEAYTKGVIITDQDLSGKGSGVSISIGSSDSSEMQIGGILENKSRSYFKKPDLVKDIIYARKQTSNFPPSVNTLTGGRIVQNFYSDDIRFFGRKIPGPLSDNSLDYYFFFIQDELSIDQERVFKIFMTPDNSSDPGFTGNLFITDSTFDLIKVDLQLNRAANTGGIFDTVGISQQFRKYEKIMMPVDYRLYISANFLGIARFIIELNTVMQDYKINQEIDDSIFDKAVISVLTDADEKDFEYWQKSQTIPNTTEEVKAYSRIDSLSKIPLSIWDRFSPLSARISLSDFFSVSAPLGMYHFNRVEGHSLDFGFFFEEAFKQRFNSSLRFSYGFSDKKFKTDLSLSYLFGEYRTYSATLSVYDRINILFGESENYKDFTSSILALVSKYEFRDYYYSNGFRFILDGEILPVVRVRGGFENNTFRSASRNSDFSFFAKNKSYKENPSIYETKVNSITLGMTLDPRDYIEDGIFRRRTSLGDSYFTFDLDVTFSGKRFLKSQLDFTTFKAELRGVINTFRSARTNIRIFGMYNDGYLPYQLLYSLPGNIDFTSVNNSFRTLEINEVLGEKVVAIFIDQDWRDEIFKFLKIPGLKDWEIQLNTFLNIALSEIQNKSASILTNSINIFRHPFYEIGFGLGHVLVPLKIELGWKLNYRGNNNFRIGINTFIF
ncbi:MAG: carboxypeptidase-like regulatory domain-containing protein [Ignavibacteriaceae bacterium]|nr:carboxypeptidase-like regulatory domain-containing protein [Ignavibacteriaceae bacterium]